MITVSEHLDRILATVPVLEVEAVPVAEASNRVLAGPVTAAIPVPPWTNSAMDGYAVRFEDLTGASKDSPVTLRVLGDLPAGSGEDPPLGPGETVRIMTGAPMPSSADTVIPQELTDGGTELVRIHDALSRGRHVREAGEDRGEGELVCPAGFELTPESLAGIVSAGVGEVVASRRPRIAVVSTGDELVAPGQPLSRGQIPDSNGLLVSMLAGEAGAEVEVDHAGDGAGELPAVLERHRGVDVLILTGGVSVLNRLSAVGLKGFMSRECVSGPCAEISFHEVRQPLPPGVAMTNVYSRRDGIVDWKACIDPEGEHVEVRASHIGLSLDPRVFRLVGDALLRQSSNVATLSAVESA